MKKLYITFSGCVESRMEASLYETYFIQNGFSRIYNISEADIVFVFTCGFAKFREDISLKKIVHVKSQAKKDAKIIIGGCLPRINNQSIRDVFNGTIINPYEIEVLNKELGLQGDFEGLKPIYFQQKQQMKAPKRLLPAGYYNNDSYLYHHYHWSNKICLVRVGTGCLGNCAYCAIKIAHPKLQSTPVDTVVDCVKQGIKNGYKNIILSADDIGAYGQDTGTNFVELLKIVLKQKGDYKIELRYVEPQWIVRYREELLEVVKGSRKISFMCVPIQSGSDRILKLMNRQYSAKDCVESINALAEQSPSIFMRTHILVGFPGETDQDFKDTLNAVHRMKFDIGQCFIYSDRSGTKADTLRNKVPDSIKKKRYDAIMKVIKRKTVLKNAIKYLQYGYFKFFD